MRVIFIDKSKAVFEDIKNGATKGLLLSAVELASSISDFTPVRTGLLKSKNKDTEIVKETSKGLSTSVINNTEYAAPIEYGTTRIAPRAMFRKGADAAVEKIEKILKFNLPK